MRRLINIFQLAELLGVSTMTVRRMWADGRMPRPMRIGKSLRWDPDVIEKWLAECSEPEEVEA